MDEFIKQAVAQLGIGESETRSATGGIFKMIKDNLGEGDFAEIASKVPGLDGLLKEAPADDKGGGDVGGSLLGAAASMLGGKAGAAVDIGSVLKKAGLNLDSAGPFLTMLISFLKDKLGDSTVAKILSSVPGLDRM